MTSTRIACIYCGGHHERSAEVRACWARTTSTATAIPEKRGEPSSAGSPDTPPAPEAEPEGQPQPDRPEPQRAGARPIPVERTTSLTIAGPDTLGRNLVLTAGDPPAPWDVCEVIDIADPDQVEDGVIARLLEAAHARRRLVFRVRGGFDPARRPDETETGEPWRLDPWFSFRGAMVSHLVLANSVDVLDGRLRFRLAEKARALGARAGTSTDVLLADGTKAWCDGGPIHFFDRAELGGAGVVHRICIEHGSLVPLGTNRGTNTTEASLAPDQLRAVTEPGATARIIAPAGSGKTRVLTERVRHLLANWKVPPSALCLVAFNVRAADEMRQRTTDLPGLQMRTLNSLALAIVNGTPPFARRPERRQTVDELVVRDLIAELVELRRRPGTDPAAAWLEALSSVRLGLRDPAAVEEDYSGDVEGLEDVFPRYRRLLSDRGLLDFDEQIYRAIELLLSAPDVRVAAQRACRLLLVDEFQDLTPAHMLLLRLVSAPDGALYGVGDDDQTIYGYADASPRWLLDFGRLFPGAAEHALTVNYRCPVDVVAATDRLLRRNRVRVHKTIRAAGDRAPAAGELTVLVHPDDDAADALSPTLHQVQSLVDGGANPGQVAVLTRVNAALVPVAVGLAEAGIPARHVLGAGWLTRSGVAPALAWLRVARSPGRIRGQDIRLALRRPPRGISPRVVDWVAEQSSLGALRRLAERLHGRDAAKVRDFVDDIEKLDVLAASGATTLAVLEAIRDDLGLDGVLHSLESSHRRLDGSAHTDDLDALMALARLHSDLATFEDWLRARLQSPPASEGVQLATVHAVKGQEWPHVIVHEATEGVMPHRLAFDVEEERRVFHVAITRGIRTVALSCGQAPSPFVAELFSEPEATPQTTKTEPSPRPSRVEAPTTVRPGQRLSAGGYEGPVEELTGEGARIRVAGALLLIPWGATVSIGGKRSRLTRPPPAPDVAERARDLLREWRRTRAQAEGRPAYTILHDTTLDSIVAGMPVSLDELATVKGIGPAKLEQFGDEILAMIAEASPEG